MPTPGSSVAQPPSDVSADVRPEDITAAHDPGAREPHGQAPQGNDAQVDDHVQRRVTELGESLAAAAGEVDTIDELLVVAGQRVHELHELMHTAREAQAVALASTERITALEDLLEQERNRVQELERDMPTLRGHLAELDGLLASERARCEELERAMSVERERAGEIERSLIDERYRTAELEAALADARADVESAIREANSARLKADAARHDAEAARLEVEAQRLDLEQVRSQAARAQHAAAHETHHPVRHHDPIPPRHAPLPPRASVVPPPAPVSEPVYEAPQPVYEEPQPVYEEPQPVYEESVYEEPVYEEPQPVYEEPQPVYEEPQPEPVDEAPEPVAEAPEAEPVREAWTPARVGPRFAPLDPEPDTAPALEADAAAPTAIHHLDPAQLHIPEALAACESWPTALAKAAQLIGQAGGWEAGVAWIVEGKERRFMFSSVWHADEAEALRLQKVMERTRRESDTIALVAAAGKGGLSFHDDLANTGDTHLATLAAEGFSSVVIVPLRVGVETIAALEFCARDGEVPGRDLERAFATVASQVSYARQMLTINESGKKRGFFRGNRNDADF